VLSWIVKTEQLFVTRTPARLKPQTDKKAFASLREIHGHVIAQLAKASHAKAQSTQRKKPTQKLDPFASSFVEKEI